MLRRANQKRLRRLLIASGLAMSLVLIVSGIGLAAYRLGRPIADGGGVINQGYLYGEATTVNGTLARHKGIDFSYLTGTHVYAVADGTVVDIANGYQNGDRGSVWGNFVLIRHDRRHYDRTTGQWAYIYSMYLHLSQWSVRVAETAHVSAGDWIADSDNTGSGSGGQHLHLQIVVNSQPDRTLEPSTLESETRSRNPELWLNPYNGNTGTVVGLVTDTNGYAVGNRLVCGPQKQAAWGYLSNLSYVDARFNPDDIMYENWGTTDVTPGPYAIYTCPYDENILCGCANPISMGTHTVQSGQVTYVGMYPVWLPYVRNKNGWSSTVVVRNNSTNFRAQVNVTLLNRDGTVYSQRATDFINPGATLPFGVPSGFDGGMLVMSSEDIAVVVREQSGDELNAYNGVTAATSEASLGWERAGATIYVPLIKNARYGRSSKIFIMNTGLQATVASVEFFNADGGESTGLPVTYALNVYGSQPVSSGNCGAGNRCSARITSSTGQPLAVVVLEQDDATTQYRATYSGFSSGATQNFAPVVKRNRYGRTTGLVIENVGASPTNITVVCFDLVGNSYNCGSYTSLPSKATFVLTPLNVPDNFVGSALVTSSGQPIATVIYESGSPQQQIANAVLNGTGLAHVPELYGNYLLSGQTTWDSGIAVQNVGTGNATVTVTYYNQAGTQVDVKTMSGLQQNRVWILNRANGYLPNNFAGSAVITANQPIVAIANHAHTGSGDTTASYSVPNR